MNKDSYDANDEDNILDLSDSLYQLQVKNSIKSKALYNLADILQQKTAKDLHEMARISSIPQQAKMRKAELLEVLPLVLIDPNLVKDKLAFLTYRQWSFFQRALKAKELKNSAVMIGDCLVLQIFGFLQVFYDKDDFIFVTPIEIKQAYRALDEEGRLENIKKLALLKEYIVAAVNLYGIISINEFIEIFNKQNSYQTSVAQMNQLSLAHFKNEEFCFWKDYLVHPVFKEDYFQSVPDLLADVNEKHRYIPNRKAFIKYANFMYWEKTPESAKLEGFLMTSLSLSSSDAQDLMDEIAMMLSNERATEEILDTIEDAFGVFEDFDELNALVQCLVAMHNNTRLWVNKGHTPNEMYKHFQRPSSLHVVKGPTKKLH